MEKIKVKVPPLKIQGIKTKLVPFILESIKWNGEGKWIEPFLGSGVVLFNVKPKRALVSDNNIHIINLYKEIQDGKITPKLLKEFLQTEGAKLEEKGQVYYYDVRRRFNQTHQSLDFLFLNRSCFNGVVRFNNKGGFNVPFCKKDKRFSQSYVTKICNQVDWVIKAMRDKDWVFKAQDWKETLTEIADNDFIYLDPPYIGRHTDYFNKWDTDDADELADSVKTLKAKFAYSMWKSNTYRENEHLIKHFSEYPCLTFNHFYHVGATENLRNSIVEGLVTNIIL
jgi:DNA adenine methylase